MNYEDAFLEGYEDAIRAINEISSTQKYLNYHSIPGDIFGGLIPSGINADLKRHSGNSFSASSLYGKYVDYCENRLGCKPLPRDQFVKEANKYYNGRATSTVIRFIADVMLPFSGTIGTAIYNRTNNFKNIHGMIDDVD